MNVSWAQVARELTTLLLQNERAMVPFREIPNGEFFAQTETMTEGGGVLTQKRVRAWLWDHRKPLEECQAIAAIQERDGWKLLGIASRVEGSNGQETQ